MVSSELFKNSYLPLSESWIVIKTTTTTTTTTTRVPLLILRVQYVPFSVNRTQFAKYSCMIVNLSREEKGE